MTKNKKPKKLPPWLKKGVEGDDLPSKKKMKKKMEKKEKC